MFLLAVKGELFSVGKPSVNIFVFNLVIFLLPFLILFDSSVCRKPNLKEFCFIFTLLVSGEYLRRISIAYK